MRFLIVSACCFGLFTSTSVGSLGDTEAQCKARYGVQLKEELQDGHRQVSYWTEPYVAVATLVNGHARNMAYAKCPLCQCE